MSPFFARLGDVVGADEAEWARCKTVRNARRACVDAALNVHLLQALSLSYTIGHTAVLPSLKVTAKVDAPAIGRRGVHFVSVVP